MQITFHVLTIFFVAATIVSSLKLSRWWVKGWDIGRVHLVWSIFVLLILEIIYLPLNQYWTIIYILILLASIIYHLNIIFPFTFFHKVEVEKAVESNFSVKIMAINIRAKNTQYQRLVDLVHQINPDIFLLTEVTQAWLDATIHLKKQYPHVILQPQENSYGMTLFSKLPIKKSEIKFLVENDVPSFHAVIDFKGKEIQFLALHPRPPAPSNDEELKDIEIIKVAELVNENSLPTIVGGDLNDVGWSAITHKFKKISGLKDPRIGRGFFNSYNALIPIFRFPIDHFFLSDDFKLLKIKRLRKIGSDHFPILIEVSIES